MKQPLLDIVMLVHDCVEWADLAIRAVEYQTKNPYRLILVDMASREQRTKDVLAAAEQRGHTVVRLSENRSFSAGVNAGVRAGSAPNVVVLNDDALVTEGWDTCFLTELAAAQVGMVGARVQGPALGAMGDPTFLRGTEAPFLVFVCIGLRRETWNVVGPMDQETFDGFSNEDLDYSWRVKKAGLKLFVSNALVIHAGSRTLARQGVDQSAETRARYEEKYSTRLLQKWGADWVTQHRRSHHPRVLVAAFSATEWIRGDFARSLLTLKATDYPFTFLNQRRMAIHLARQVVANYALDNGFDVIVSLDDDATFPADLLPRLLNHNREIVCALAYQRFAPYGTVAYELSPDCYDATGNVTLDKEGLKSRMLDNLEGQGLRKIDITGFHCSAIRTSVFAKLKAAGITQYYGGFENKLGEDFAFCCNLKKAGIPIYLDTDLVSGHIGENVVVTREYKAAFKAGRAL